MLQVEGSSTTGSTRLIWFQPLRWNALWCPGIELVTSGKSSKLLTSFYLVWLWFGVFLFIQSGVQVKIDAQLGGIQVRVY
jgi:hypothetical protein